MKREEIEQRVNHFLIKDIEIEEELIHPDANLTIDLGIDSLDVVDIVVIIEQVFKVKIRGEELAKVKTLGAFYDYIETKLNG